MLVMTLDMSNAIIQYGQLGVSAGLFLLVWQKHRKGTLTTRTLKKTVWFFIAFLLAVAAVKIAAQYFVFKSDPFSKLFLPPYQPIDWFAYSMGAQHIAPLILSAGAGLFMFFAAHLTVRYARRELFLENDKFILLLAALITGWPQFVLYLALVMMLTLAWSLSVSVMRKDFGNRIVLTNALLAAIPVVLLLGGFVAPYLHLWKLTI